MEYTPEPGASVPESSTCRCLPCPLRLVLSPPHCFVPTPQALPPSPSVGTWAEAQGMLGSGMHPTLSWGMANWRLVLPWTHGAIVHSSSHLPLMQVKKASEVEVAIPSESSTTVDWGSGPVWSETDFSIPCWGPAFSVCTEPCKFYSLPYLGY